MIYIIWYDMLCYDIWYVVMWYNVKWYDVIRYDIIRYVMIYDMLWHDMIWYDMIWYDMIWYDMIWYDMIWYDTFVNCNWVASRWQQYSTHLQTHNTQNNTKIVLEECEPCLIFAVFTLAFVLELMKKHGKPSVRVAEECQLTWWRYIIMQ